MTNREICLKAAQRLREVGWRQGGIGGKDGPHCMLGACMWVTRYHATDVAAFGAAYTAAYAAAYTTAIAWNDTPGRTTEEVIAALEACP